MSITMEEITLADIHAAAERIAPLAHRTPVITSRLFDEVAGVKCYFKCENFQRGGAFKIRGAANLILSLTEKERQRGVVAFSSGNHAQAVAIAAQHVGAQATILMPLDAPRAKVEATRGYGAQIVHYDRFREDREALSRRIAEESGAVLVPPYDDLRIITGQGTAVLELLEDAPDVDAVVACIGGGGLLAGTATTAKFLKPDIRVFGVEPELGNDTYLSRKAGKRVAIDPPATLADGLRGSIPGAVTFPILQRLVDDILLVSEEEIKTAMRFLLTRLKIVVEPSGAVSAAVVLAKKLPLGVRSVGIILTGGNVDLDVLAAVADE